MPYGMSLHRTVKKKQLIITLFSDNSLTSILDIITDSENINPKCFYN